MPRTCAAPNCEELLPEGSRAVTHSPACRQRLVRFKKRNARASGLAKGANHAASPGAVLEGLDPQEIALDVFKQELTPLVREAITEETVTALAALVKLTPVLVESLGEDLTSHDAVARGRAQSITAKYTLGRLDNGDDKGSQPLTVVLPDSLGGEAAQPADAVEVRECQHCHQEKTVSEFEPGAPRCFSCQDEIKAGILERYGD